MAQRSNRKKQGTTSRSPAKRGFGLRDLPWKVLLQAAILIGLALWIYTPALHGLWLWDDDFLLQNNEEVHDPTGLYYIWFMPSSMIDFMPVTVSVYWLIWQISPDNVFAYHVTSLVFHLISVMLFWLVLRKLGLRRAWIGALLFTIHPALVESVAWMAELKNTVGMPPFLLAVLAWISFDRTRRIEYYIAAVLLFLVAMLAKPAPVAFPVIIILYAWWKHGKISFWKDIHSREELKVKLKAAFWEQLWIVVPTIPFFIISISITVALIFLLRHGVGEQFIPLGGPLSRLACAGTSILFYFSKCALPLNLIPIYPQWDINPPNVWQFLPWPVMAFGFWWLWKRRDQDWARAALFGFGYFFLTLVPFVGWRAISFMRFQWVMDHFLYVPILGLFGLVAAAIDDLYGRIPAAEKRWRYAAIAGGLVIVAILTIGSHRYAKVFVDRLAYWTYTAHRNYVAWPAHNNRGNQLLEYRRYNEAEEEFKIALELNPKYTEAHNNLGYIYSLQGRYKEAEYEFNQALIYTPDFESAQMNLRQVLQIEAAQTRANPEKK